MNQPYINANGGYTYGGYTIKIKIILLNIFNNSYFLTLLFYLVIQIHNNPNIYILFFNTIKPQPLQYAKKNTYCIFNPANYSCFNIL